MNKLMLAVSLGLLSQAAMAEMAPIPQQSGFSGFGLLGGSYSNVNSNVVVGPKEESSRRLDSLSSHTGSDGGKADINLDLRYTFADTRTQLFLGNLIQDAVRLDFTQQFGVRQQIGNKGIISGAFVFSGIPGEAWEDPYAVGTERQTTDRKSNGMRLGWDGIWGSQFSANYTVRKIEIEDERSGASLSLSPAEQALLDRNGNMQSIDLAYNLVGPQGSVLSPMISYSRNDADGKASSYDRTAFQLTYALQQAQYSLVTNFFAGQVEYDAVNPVFGRTVKADEWGVNANLFWHNLWSVKPLSAVFSASYGNSDANVDFFDTELSRISAGLMYRF